MHIGILGGTFDPIHFGHIKPALEIKQKLLLDEVWLMPNHIPPHKQSTNITTQHRLKMVQDVCLQYPQLQLCDIEINRDTPSYTVVTLQQLKQAYPQASFYFIMGMDSFINLPSWHLWQQLFELCHIVLCQRPGWTLPPDSPMQQVLNQRATTIAQLIDNKNNTSQNTHGDIIPVDICLQNISSTEIRQKVQSNQDISKLLAPCTINYIQQHHLYRR
ncbi:nicotinate-nucleotide adenylyltransferase [Shewanella aestuarii]|uniref:Probable nicotinate-nucleotide adenylyltransferase n=1 Tax=Shewanella aestuarii TaxID=1028752 RepID=A0A6G9QLW9_9GAMM|nr:nicotinate-nucleotide adenylyltransferase [Shewanella aestuarii]QIR15472.1 nicotinate-nucleotide adenylyltransferase [Shewanella aestuarii]